MCVRNASSYNADAVPVTDCHSSAVACSPTNDARASHALSLEQLLRSKAVFGQRSLYSAGTYHLTTSGQMKMPFFTKYPVPTSDPDLSPQELFDAAYVSRNYSRKACMKSCQPKTVILTASPLTPPGGAWKSVHTPCPFLVKAGCNVVPLVQSRCHLMQLVLTSTHLKMRCAHSPVHRSSLNLANILPDPGSAH